MKRLLVTLLATTLSGGLLADIEITIRDQYGRTSTISSNGQAARMNNDREPGYMLIDFASNSMKSVDTQRREIMDLSGMADMPPMPGAGAATPIQVRVNDQGAGPHIAGHATQKFAINANGKNCGTVFGSKMVMNLPGVSDIFEVFSTMQKQTQRMGGGFRSMLDECQQADLQMADHYRTVGAPLRVLDQHGQLESEVTRINTNASKPVGYYDAPPNYRVNNVQQQMQQARQQRHKMMQQMQNNGLPDMDQIMQQMQQQPGMPPDAMERMRKMQEMLKQQFPQQ